MKHKDGALGKTDNKRISQNVKLRLESSGYCDGLPSVSHRRLNHATQRQRQYYNIFRKTPTEETAD